MKDLTGVEYALRKIFSSDYEFTIIPDYQRPYARGKEQALQLDEWTPAVIEARQANLLAALHKEWELN